MSSFSATLEDSVSKFFERPCIFHIHKDFEILSRHLLAFQQSVRYLFSDLPSKMSSFSATLGDFVSKFFE